MDELQKIPPVTRYFLGAVMAATIPTLLEIMTVYPLVLHWPFVLEKREFWRLATCFLYGGKGLGFLMSIYMVFKHSSELEENKYFRSTSKYTWALLMNALLLIALNKPLGTMILFGPFLNALIWLWSRANLNARTSFFGFVTVPAAYLPYIYLLMDLLQGGPGALMVSATGLIAGFIWTQIEDGPDSPAPFGTLNRLGITNPPGWLQRMLPDSVDPSLGPGPTPTGGAGRRTEFGNAYAPRDRNFGEAYAGAGRTINDPPASAPSGPIGAGRGAGILNFLGLDRGQRAANDDAAGEGQPTRDDILAAAERRLRSQAADSIIGRHHADAAKPAEAPISSAGGSSLGADGASRSSALQGREGGATSRSRGAASSGSGGMSFADMAARDERAKGATNEDASGSGGRVAEQRRDKGKGADFSFSKNGQQGGQGDADQSHNWGEGRALGE